MITTLQSGSRYDVKVIGVDSNVDAIGRHFADEFVRVPYGSAPDYIDVLADTVAKHGVDLVLPTSDEEALAVSRSKNVFSDLGCAIACADIETLELLSNKARCYAFLSSQGIQVPIWKQANTLPELKEAVGEFEERGIDFVIKPVSARGGRGIRVISSSLSGAEPVQVGREVHMDASTFRKQYMGEFVNMMPAMVMERLVEPVHDIDMLAWNGTPLRVIPRRRVDSARPNEGHVLVDNPDLIALGESLIKALNLSWLYDCDLMMNALGEPGVLEINPRPSGSIAATITAGVPLLNDVIALAKGETVEDIQPPFGKIVVPYKTFKVLS